MPLFRRAKQSFEPVPLNPQAAGARPAAWPGQGPVQAAVTAPQEATDPRLIRPREERGDGDPLVLALLDAADARDWPAARAVLAGCEGQDRIVLSSRLSAEAGVEDWLPAVVEADPDDSLALAVLGSHTITRAWSVRTAKRAPHVSQEQFAAFHEILREAEALLYRSIEADRANPAPWASLMASGRGLEVGMEVLERRFEAATTRCPANLAAYHSMLQSCCRKWSGSDEKMHAFALEAMRGPHGEVLGELVPYAHLELWASLPTAERPAYIGREDVRAELREAAQRTIDKPGYVAPRPLARVYNIFADAFGVFGMYEESFAAFEKTRGVVTRMPWSDFNRRPPQDSYLILQKQVLSHL